MGFSLVTLVGLMIGTGEVSLVLVLFGTLVDLIIGTGELSLVGLSLGLPHGYPLESTNTGVDMPGTLMGASLGLWFLYEAVRCRYWCSWCRLMDCRKATCGGVIIYCIPPSVSLITSNMNSLRYCQLLELLHPLGLYLIM